jgi:integrase
MARTPRPWWRSQKQVWCVKVGGRRLTLGPHPEGSAAPKYNKKKDLWNVPELIAEAFKKLQAGERPTAPSDTTWAIMDRYLTWCEANRPASYSWYVDHLQRFKDGVPNMPISKLKAFHVEEWLATKKDWGPSYKRGHITAVKRVFNWGVEQGHIENSPLRSLKKPEGESRDQLISPAQFKEILKQGKDENFRDVLRTVWLTGMRPQEVVRIEARHLKEGFIEFEKAESKGKKDERQIFLTDEALKVCKKWAKRNPEGAIFRNTRGRPWTAFAFNNRFCRMQEALGYKVAMYAIRHSWAHHAITTGGLTLEEAAALMGHKSTQMVYQRYGKLKKNKAFMREAAKRAISNGGA